MIQTAGKNVYKVTATVADSQALLKVKAILSSKKKIFTPSPYKIVIGFVQLPKILI
jgi:hypothetical protein